MNAPAPEARPQIRVDLQLIADMIEPKTRVLDVGAGDGTLLDYLVHYKRVDGRGIELSQEGVKACVSHGLSVIQGNAETDLKDYPADAFDYVILSQTLLEVRDTKGALEQLMRIGHRAIVSFPNFGHWRIRWYLLWSGRTPMTPVLPYQWYDTPNIRLCTVDDFLALCREMEITVRDAYAVDMAGRARRFRAGSWLTNWRAQQAVFLLARE